MPPADRTAWARLGRLLAERRVQISPRYANRRLFAGEREMNWRTLHDIELAKRGNFRPETMRAFEAAYMLVPGSLDRVLAGGDLEPLPVARATAPEPARRGGEPQGDAAWDLFPDDETKRHVWRTPGLSEDERAAIIALIDRRRPGSAAPERQADAGLPNPPRKGNP